MTKILKPVANNVFSYVDGDTNFTVAVLPGVVALYGTPGSQFFTSSVEGITQDSFLDIAAIKAAAQLHRDTAVNKDKFLTALSEHEALGIINRNDVEVLVEFIDSCDCPPKTVRKKLSALGYGRIADIDFEDELPEFTATAAAFDLFLKAAREIIHE